MKDILVLESNQIFVIPTDTIYGIVGSALNPEIVEKIYKLRKRTPSKPMVILISSFDDLKKFNINLNDEQNRLLQKIWPNPVSVIMPIEDPRFEYLHRGKKSLSFRMPKSKWLQNVLKASGPLVAPSANFEGEKPADTIDEARKYFGDSVEYIDGGALISKPSTLIEFEGDEIKILREGVLTKGEIRKLLE